MISIQRADGSTVDIPAVQDHGLSFSAHGLLAYMLSFPAGTVFTVEQLDAQTPEGHSEVGPALRELEEHGYFRDGVIRDAAEPE
jgi:hypothetical protein